MGYRRKKNTKKQVILYFILVFILVSVSFVLYKNFFSSVIINTDNKEIIEKQNTKNKTDSKNKSDKTILANSEKNPTPVINNNRLIEVKDSFQYELNSFPKNYFLKRNYNLFISSIYNSNNSLDSIYNFKSINNNQIIESKRTISINNSEIIDLDVRNNELFTKKGKLKKFFIDFFVLQETERDLVVKLKWKKNKVDTVQSFNLLIPKTKNEIETQKWYYFSVNLGKLDRKNQLFNHRKVYGDEKEQLYHKIELKIESIVRDPSVDNKKEIFITPPQLYTVEKKEWFNKKKNNIIFIDVANLTTKDIEIDSTFLPNIYNLSQNGNYFKDCSANSENKELAITSYLTGFYPSELYYKDQEKNQIISNDFTDERQKITSSLRNMTFAKFLKNKGYETSHISNIKSVVNNFNLIQDLGFQNNTTLIDEESDNGDSNKSDFDTFQSKMIHKLFNSLNLKLNLYRNVKEFFIHIIIDSKSRKDLKIIDTLLGEFLKKSKDMNNTIVLTSSYQQQNDDMEFKFYRRYKKPTIFFNTKNIKDTKINEYRVNLFDIVKTTLAYSNISYPYHYPGKNLLKVGINYPGRNFVLKENGHNSKSIENEKFYYKFTFEDGSKYSENLFNFEGNGKFYNDPLNKIKYKQTLKELRSKLQNQSGADFLKKITFFNNTEEIREYSLELISKQKFILFNDIENYYRLKKNKRKNRYIKKIKLEIEPNEKKELSFFFRKRDQKFLFKLKNKSNIGYGENLIPITNTNRFEEKSNLGFFNNLSTSKMKFSSSFDIQIINYELYK